jgi:flagellin
VDERPAEYKTVAILDGEQVELETGQSTLNFKNSGISLKFKDAFVVNSSKSTLSTGSKEMYEAITIDVSKSSGKPLTIQTGANEGDNLQITLAKLDAYSLGIASANISNRMDSSVAITQVNSALNVVSTQRAALGALQNRLEFKISNLDIGAENLQAAESRIRDVDMAKEMTSFTKNNILFQASTAMLAQANALPQGVLQLLG